MISVLTGHLTPTNKKHIEAMFKRGLMEGTINGITYYISSIQKDEYKVKVIVKDNSIIFGEPFRIMSSTFKRK